ncbi:MAG: pyridoxal-phosphate dependent enzyme [Chloroflexota bacterium]|nr:pyridoxal-phosphate dependent enzyme [Chloroflexota bacterium]
MNLQCADCAQSWPIDFTRWRCDCGGVLEIAGVPSFDPARVNEQDYTLWRYQAMLPLPDGATPVTLGAGWTPLVAAEWDDQPIYLKAEYLNPTGSFKDRGAAVLVTALKAAGVGEVVEDSSGNAGAALSAYAARAGLNATIYVPAHASSVKQAQIASYGAEVVPVVGPRSEAARVVRQAAGEGAVYASHVYSPFYPQGMKTIAFELWEQLGGRAPESVVVPLGHGGLLLGLHRGFGELLAAGFIERLPCLFGVQAQPCAPLARAWDRGVTDVEPVEEEETVAEGVRIAAPPWGRVALAVVRASGGLVLALPDEETLAAQKKLAQRGFYVEPTSALVVAALDHLRDRLGKVPVVVLTGSGFKSPPPMAGWQRKVAAFARRHNLIHDLDACTLDLVSEVGEVAKEVLLATDYGQRAPQFRPQLASELGDALYSLLALVEACGVDTDSALDATLEKYEHRLTEREGPGSR